MKKNYLSEIMRLAWQFAKQTGMSFSTCLKKAWLNYKLKKAMYKSIVKFYYQKVDGTIREAWGSLEQKYMPELTSDRRAKNNTVQVYYDTEKQEFRCFKKVNLIAL